MKRDTSLPVFWPNPDRDIWHDSIHWKGFFASRKESKWADSTKRSYASSYGRWISFLQATYPESLVERPTQRVHKERLERYIQHLSQALAPQTIGRYVYNLYRVLRVLEPTTDLKWLYYLSWNMMRDAAPNWRWDIVRSPTLAAVGERLMDRVWFAASRGKRLDRDMRRKYRDGLIIILMAHTAMRIGTFSQISTHNCVQIAGRWTIVIPANLTKTKKKDDDYPLNEELSRYMTFYLERVRPHFLNAKETASLWIDDSRILTLERIRERIMDRTLYSLGEPVPPHDFRRSVATTIMLESPQNIQAAQDLLSHASGGMTKKYIQASRSLLAGKTLAEIIDGKRVPRPVKGKRSQ